jgi:hypothetical protein
VEIEEDEEDDDEEDKEEAAEDGWKAETHCSSNVTSSGSTKIKRQKHNRRAQ